jgi:CheY-like chemotaxis protein/signal transduction histidine kinase
MDHKAKQSVDDPAVSIHAGLGLPVFFVNAKGEILSRNSKGLALGEVSRFSALFEAFSHLDRLFATALESGSVERPFRLLSGREVLLSIQAGVHDGLDGFTVVLFDVTNYHMLSEERQLSRRLTAVGNLAAGVAYEISNPLTVLLGRLEFLAVAETPDPQLVHRHLGVMQAHASRIASTVKNLQVFAHPALGVRESVPLAGLLQAAMESSQARIGRVQVALVVEPENLSTTGDPALLEQVFTALFIAVAEGSGRRGRLVVQAKMVDEICQIRIGTDPSETMGAEFLSLESAPQGIGFGVTLAGAIVREHSGQLRCCQVERRFSFLLELPLARSQRAEGTENDVQWRVLFVDDDRELCALGKDMISASGHECTTAESAEEALAIMENEEFDLVVADVRMPGLSGLAFREIVSKRWAHLQERVVLVTGLSMRPPDGVRLLQKPFTQGQLLQVLAEANADGEKTE